VEGWTARTPSEALLFGDGFHYALEHLPADPTPTPEQIEHVIQVEWSGRLLGNNLTQAERTIRARTKALLIATLLGYHEHHSDDDFCWIGREQQFKVPTTAWIGETPVSLRGKKDGVFEVKGKRWLFETKTRGTVDAFKTLNVLSHDLQALLYAYSETVEHTQPAGILYNVVRRSGLRPKQGEKIDDYGSRVLADIRERPEWYFFRWQITLVPGEVQKWYHATLEPILEDLIEWYLDLESHRGDSVAAGRHYMNAAVLMAPESNELFRLLTTGDKFGLYQRTVAHPELDG
jgi:hypothetical protein